MILGSFAAGVGLLCLRPEHLRKLFVALATAAVCCGAMALLRLPAPLGAFTHDYHWVNLGMMFGEAAMAGYIVYISIRSRKPLILALILAQAGLILWFELAHGPQLRGVRNLYLDKFSVILALINGVVGGGICVYALGYMREYHEAAHRDVADRRPLFFALLFVFLGAMFGIIFANNLLWLFFFWEVTTLCSFLLIGYTGTAEARENALKALAMNLAGGLAFAIAIVWLYQKSGTVELQILLASKSGAALVPAALLCFAGMTKAAQLPFSGWLLGAMVAPTPVSALLHSSTMVKAGVYLVLRLSPVLTWTSVGMLVALVGATTFLVASLAAITASDAKKVLAYSTIGNLGLIVLCGGIGTDASVWAGVLLIIFHAVAKCLLFLCVGIVEHKSHSRDIETMSGLILRMPQLAVMMLIGMAGMFLAPFGMLISKWAVLKAVVDAFPALSIFVVFGSAATLFFWVKWMGKLLEVVKPREQLPEKLAWGETVALYGLSGATFLACLLFPLISSSLIEPYVAGVYGHSTSLGQGNVIIMTIMMVMVMLFPLSFINYGRGVKVMDAYLGGANAQSSVRFTGSGNTVCDVTLRNYYLQDFFNEKLIAKWGRIAGTALLAAMLTTAVLSSREPAVQQARNAATAPLPSPQPTATKLISL